MRFVATGTFKDARFDPPKLRHAGDPVELTDPARIERWTRRDLVRPVRSGQPPDRGPWGQHYGRDLRVIEPDPYPYRRVVACLNVWNGMGSLEHTLPTWYEHVDHVIAVDGAYKGTPTRTAASDDGTLAFLRGLEKVEVIEAEGRPDQCVKRTRYFDACREGDILFVVDDDEYIEGAENLRSLPWLDVGWCELDSALYERSQGIPRVFRWQAGLHYRGRHHWIYQGDRLVTTSQNGGAGYEHVRVPIRIENTRGAGRAPVRNELAKTGRTYQAIQESEVDSVGHSRVGGREPLRILNLSRIDAGCAVYRWHSALNTTTPHESAYVKSRNEYFEAPGQYRATEDRDLVRDAARSADVLHCHLSYHPLKALGVRHRGVIVAHHHGTMLRSDPESRRRDDEREGAALRLVSNLELLSYGDDLRWLPNPMPWARYRRLKESAPERDGPFRVAHSPSKRRLKGTEGFLHACKRLKAKGLDIEPVLIEGASHAESIRLKATCDAAFDSFWLGIQCSGLEAACMGVPVIAGDRTVADRYRARIGDVPYTFADSPGELEWALESLMTDPDLYDEEAARVSQYAREWHDYGAVTMRYLDLLNDAVDWQSRMKLGSDGRLNG